MPLTGRRCGEDESAGEEARGRVVASVREDVWVGEESGGVPEMKEWLGEGGLEWEKRGSEDW
jgi:hypothetical protein